jgi:hypothetical protein
VLNEPAGFQAFREGWDKHKADFGSFDRFKPRIDFYLWSPTMSTWNEYGAPYFTGREPIAGATVDVSGFFIDVRDLFIKVMEQFRSFSTALQQAAKWDPKTGAWVRVTSILNDLPQGSSKPLLDWAHHPTAGEIIQNIGARLARGEITPDQAARELDAAVQRFHLTLVTE